MMEAACHDWNAVEHRRRALVGTGAGRPSSLQRLAMISVMGMFVCLPIQALDLPLNTAPVDLWNAIALPIAWIYLLGKQRGARFPYITAMWLILLSSLIAMLWARDVSAASVVVLKEVYLYIWFVTVALLLAEASARDLKMVLLVWSAMALLHGIIIIAEFLSTDVWHALASFFGALGKVEVNRPPGLFDNANGAAFFQLMSFVPILLSCRSSRLAVPLCLLLVLTIIGTGSLGATVGLLAGTVVAFVAMAVAGGDKRRLYRTLIWLLLIGAALWVLHAFMMEYEPDYEARLAYFFYSRAERSAEGRFGLWQSGLTVLSSDWSLWGVGPENFTDPVSGKTLHNDLLAFAVERGVAGAFGLLLFGALATQKAVRVLKNSAWRAHSATGVVFLAAAVASLVESQFHQVFHERALWLVLAVQEAILMRTIVAHRQSSPKRKCLEARGARRRLFPRLAAQIASYKPRYWDVRG
jgi:O-antigen ligase/polysaccharide polymerase Wzy-like membrane protein